MQDSMECYSCPAGSVLIFTESLIHASNDWLLPNPRVAIFNCCESQHNTLIARKNVGCENRWLRHGFRLSVGLNQIGK